MEAENLAVDLINAHFGRYAHYVVAAAGGALQPEELLRPFSGTSTSTIMNRAFWADL